ncbi:hypothetical protein V1515DRAFT_57262 [Lipomyces mesembrius]
MMMDITMKPMQCMIFWGDIFTVFTRVYSAATYDGYFAYAPLAELYYGLSTFIYGMYCIFCSSFVCFWSFWKFWEYVYLLCHPLFCVFTIVQNRVVTRCSFNAIHVIISCNLDCIFHNAHILYQFTNDNNNAGLNPNYTSPFTTPNPKSPIQHHRSPRY